MYSRILYRLKFLVSPLLCAGGWVVTGGWILGLLKSIAFFIVFALIVLLCKCSPSVGWALSLFGLLFLVGGLFYVLYPLMGRSRFRVWGFVILFTWGCLGYWNNHVDRKEVLPRCGYAANPVALDAGRSDAPWYAMLFEVSDRTLSAFFPSRGGFESLPDGASLFWYYFFHFCVLFYVGGILYAFFGRRQMDRLQWRWVFPEKDLNVFWGYSDRAEKLAQNIVDTSCSDQILFRIAKDMSRDDRVRGDIERLTKLGCMFDLSESAAVSTNSFVGVRTRQLKNVELRGRRHYFIGDDARNNLVLLDSFVKILVAGSSCEMKQLYVRINSRDEGELLASWADSLKPLCKGKAEIHMFNEVSLTGRMFANSYPMLDSLPKAAVDTATGMVNGSFKLLIVGFGELGQHMLKREICDSQFKGSSFSADIIADGSDVADYKVDFAGELEAYKGVVFHEYNAYANGSVMKTLGSILGGIDEYTRIIVCTDDQSANLQIGMRIRRAFMDIGKPLIDASRRVFVWDPGRELKDCIKGVRLGITLFGALDDIYTRHILIDEGLDSAAMQLNYVYYRQYHKDDDSTPEKVWAESAYLDKESSRASVLGERNILRLLGYDIVDVVNSDGRSDCAAEYAEKVKSPAIISLLAENEHLRWNAYHFVKGVLRWNPKEQVILGATKANQIAEYNRHAALVPFDELPDVDVVVAQLVASAENRACNVMREDYIGGGFQKSDMNFVEQIPQVQKHAGKKIVKRNDCNEG